MIIPTVIRMIMTEKDKSSVLSRKAPNLLLLLFKMGKILLKRPEHILNIFFYFSYPLGISTKIIKSFNFRLVLNTD